MVKRIFPWIDSLRLLFKSPPSFKYLPRALAYNLLVLIQQPFHWIELLIWSHSINTHKLPQAPIFILGYWRSGTTYLQRLLCLNAQLGYLHQYEALLPLGARVHGPVLRPLAGYIVQKLNIKHPTHGVPLSMDFPSEEDVALCAGAYPHSPMQAHIYSKKALKILDAELFAKADSNASKRFKKMYSYLVKRLSYFNKGRQLVLKSPSNTTKIRELLELYPDAKFIYIERNPKEVYFSKMKLLRNNKVQWLQAMSEAQMQQVFIETYPRVLQNYQENKKEIPTENLIELSFEDLCANPLLKLEAIYNQFNIAGWDAVQTKLEPFLDKNHEKKRYYYEQELPVEIQKLFEKISATQSF